jgi:hypothetical protein
VEHLLLQLALASASRTVHPAPLQLPHRTVTPPSSHTLPLVPLLVPLPLHMQGRLLATTAALLYHLLTATLAIEPPATTGRADTWAATPSRLAAAPPSS